MYPPGVVEREATLSHGRTRYLEAGEGTPVILLHGVGFLDGGDSWLPNIVPLSAHLRVLAPDILGWGPGDQLSLAYSFAYLVDFVREFQDALGIDRCHVVGHSMGGWVASLLAYESPHRVSKLVLSASGGLATRQLSSMARWEPPTADEVRARFERLTEMGIDPEPFIRTRLELTRQEPRVDQFRKIMEHMSHPETRKRYHTARRLPFVSCPTLVIWGRQDEVNPLDMGRSAHQLIPDSRLEIVEDCGHHIPSEKAAEFNSILGDFLHP